MAGRASGQCPAQSRALLAFIFLGLPLALAVIIYLAIAWWHSRESSFLLGSLPRSNVRELSIEEMERTLSEIVVPIGNQPKNWAGSAVAIQPRRLLSVCHAGKDGMVTLVQGQFVRLRLRAERLAADECLFETDRRLPRVVPGVRTISSLISHEPLYVFGYPSGAPTLSPGVFNNFTLDDSGRLVIRTTARVASGDSGGGLFDRFGNLIGIVRARYGDKASFAVPVEDWWEK